MLTAPKHGLRPATGILNGLLIAAAFWLGVFLAWRLL